VVVPEETPRVVPDDPDDKLVAAALTAGALLVTNDAHLLAIADHNGLRVKRPAEVCDGGKGLSEERRHG
jgi:predicted nucleic acid-binding protein